MTEEEGVVVARNKAWTSAISRYRKANPGTHYSEAARAVCFDEPWRSEVQVALSALRAGREG
jgi:hypothetical protein